MKAIIFISIGIGFLLIGGFFLLSASGSPELSKRKQLGAIERLLHPGYGSCHRCGRSWAVVDGHSTPYHTVEPATTHDADNFTTISYVSSSCFPLCEQCWKELTPEQRLPFYRKLIDGWMSDGSPDYNGLSWDEIWAELKKNVLAGL